MAASKKSSPSKPPARKRQSTIEVDMTWLDQLPEEEKPEAKRAKKAAVDKTIDVESRWLVPPLPKDGKGKAKPSTTPGPPPLPSALAVKPRGKLPPPLPREDDEDEGGS